MTITARRLTAVPTLPAARQRALRDPAPLDEAHFDLDFRSTGTHGPAPLPATLPDPDAWLRTVTVAILEAQSGQRPAHQVTKWLSAEVAKTVSRRAESAQRRRVPRSAVHIRHIRCQSTAHGAIEAGICLHAGGRTRAAAVRLEPHRSRWVVTAFELG